MLGERSDQRGLWEADRLYLDHVGRDTFYGMLASLRGRLFRDAEFAEFYCPDNGRDSVPPSLLATALLLQSHDKVSDAEAKARADFDIRWKVALGIEIEDRPFAKSTLQVFRAQLILHDKVREVFEGSLRLARESGYLQKRGMKVALDTTNILGRGAVKDTCNLLADGIVKLLRALAQLKGINVGQWAKSQGYHRYLGSSAKGEAAIDWADRQARAGLLAGIVGDADRLLELSRQAQGELPEDSAERQRIVDAAELLGRLLLQDVERTDDGVSLKDGVSRDRMMSVHDPEMRHGHKSSSRRFDGHKAAIVVDTDSQLITAVEVLPGNAPDNLGALELVEASEANTGVTLEEAMGDAAYGDGDTRQTFADAGRTLIARVPGRPNRSHFPKEDFRIDLESGSCTCPAGQVTRTIVPAGRRTDQTGRTYRLEAFRFDAAVCGECPLRSQCLAAKPGTGRTVRLHPQEALLQQARALQHSEAFAEYRQRRVVVEHRLARLVQLGIRQSRYCERAKTRFQLYLAATVANLTLVAAKAGLTGETGSGPPSGRRRRCCASRVVGQPPLCSAVPTPQSEPLNERQVPNSAGGYSYPVDNMTRLRRFLILGSEGGSYYADERKLTLENANAVKRCITALENSGIDAVGEIIALSQARRAPKPGPVLFALAMAASYGSDVVRWQALNGLPLVAHTGSHLQMFIDCVGNMRGWGRILRRAVGKWYTDKDIKDAVYQAVKYRQRYSWTHRDLLRKAHPKAVSSAFNDFFAWVTKGTMPSDDPEFALIHAYEQAKTADENILCTLIAKHQMTWEMVPAEMLDKRQSGRPWPDTCPSWPWCGTWPL